MELFRDKIETFDLPNAYLEYYPMFYTKAVADQYFESLLNTINWIEDDITLFGKTYKQPRLTAFYSNSRTAYSYSNITMYPLPFTEDLMAMKTKIETATATQYNSVLLNLYRHGSDSNGWHADNEKTLGINPVIASLSFGQERFFHFKHRTLKHEKYKLLLKHGSLLIMKGEMQHHWLHQIAKTKRNINERINLTFRFIK